MLLFFSPHFIHSLPSAPCSTSEAIFSLLSTFIVHSLYNHPQYFNFFKENKHWERQLFHSIFISWRVLGSYQGHNVEIYPRGNKISGNTPLLHWFCKKATALLSDFGAWWWLSVRDFERHGGTSPAELDSAITWGCAVENC